MSDTIIKTLDNGYEEIDVEITFYYQPEEPMTWDYPGCAADVEIECVERVDDGAEIVLLNTSELEEKILTEILNKEYLENYDYV